jgi:hypothetical protein
MSSLVPHDVLLVALINLSKQNEIPTLALPGNLVYILQTSILSVKIFV